MKVGRGKRLASPGVVALMLALAPACGDAPLTTDLDGGYGEITSEMNMVVSAQDVVLILDPELPPAVEPRLRALISALVTGELDDIPGQDAWALPHARIAVMTPRQATDAIAALQRLDEPSSLDPQGPLPAIPFVRYRWAPHGYADDVDSMVNRVLCLRGPDAADCASAMMPGEVFASGFAQAYVVTARDSCGPAAADGGSCDIVLTDLLARSVGAGPIPWWPVLIAGFPSDLTTLEAWRDAPTRDDYLRAIARDPRVASSTDDPCAGTLGPDVVPAPQLLQSVALSGDGVLSICANDYRPVLHMIDCGGFFDFGRADIDPGRVARLDDGTTPCQLEELLPAQGPVTRCEQLADFGRTGPLSTEEAQALCRVDQLSEEDGLADRDFGFFMTTDPHASVGPLGRGKFPAPCRGYLGGSGLGLAFSKRTHAIVGSTLRLRCPTNAAVR